MNDFHWSLAEIEHMIPFERELYLLMLAEKLDKEKKMREASKR
jgi:hypothetical protein